MTWTDNHSKLTMAAVPSAAFWHSKLRWHTNAQRYHGRNFVQTSKWEGQEGHSLANTDNHGLVRGWLYPPTSEFLAVNESNQLTITPTTQPVPPCDLVRFLSVWVIHTRELNPRVWFTIFKLKRKMVLHASDKDYIGECLRIIFLCHRRHIRRTFSATTPIRLVYTVDFPFVMLKFTATTLCFLFGGFGIK